MAFANPKKPSESILPALGMMPRRCVFVWYCAVFRDRILLIRWATPPLRRSTACVINFADVKSLHTCMPSAHVWSKFISPTSPQLLNQPPPRAQQLRLPDFLVLLHLRHPLLLLIIFTLVVVDDSVRAWVWIPTRDTVLILHQITTLHTRSECLVWNVETQLGSMTRYCPRNASRFVKPRFDKLSYKRHWNRCLARSHRCVMMFAQETYRQWGQR